MKNQNLLPTPILKCGVIAAACLGLLLSTSCSSTSQSPTEQNSTETTQESETISQPPTEQNFTEATQESETISQPPTEQNSTETAQESETATYESNSSSERLKNATVFKADVMNGFGTEVIGQRAYIIIPKDDLKNVTENEFSEFVNSNIKDKDYNWFTITCDDGTGINFAGGLSSFATYGKVDNEGSITEPIGYITLTENGYIYE